MDDLLTSSTRARARPMFSKSMDDCGMQASYMAKVRFDMAPECLSHPDGVQNESGSMLGLKTLLRTRLKNARTLLFTSPGPSQTRLPVIKITENQPTVAWSMEVLICEHLMNPIGLFAPLRAPAAVAAAKRNVDVIPLDRYSQGKLRRKGLQQPVSSLRSPIH